MTMRLVRFMAFSALVLASFSACSGGTASQSPATADNPPPLDDDDSGSGAPAPASSGKVKEGMDAIQAGDFAKAKTVLEQAAKENPKDPQAAYYLGVAVEGLGDGKGATEHYKKALELDPKLTEASINLSGVLLDANDVEGALSAANAGLKSAPKNPSLLRNRAVALDATGSKDAVAAFKSAVAAASNDKEIRYLYAEALVRAGDKAAALTELKALTSSDDVAVLASVGRLLGKLKAFDECIAAFDNAIKQKDAAELRVDRGLCKHGKKDDKGAGADFEAAVSADAKFAPAHFYLAQNKRDAGDKKGAKAEFEKAASLDPGGKLGAAAKKELSELK
jgi:Tfp pilus assembly protein PilF